MSALAQEIAVDQPCASKAVPIPSVRKSFAVKSRNQNMENHLVNLMVSIGNDKKMSYLGS